MVPKGKFVEVNLRDRECAQAKILKRRLHTDAQRSSFWFAFEPILEFLMKATGIGRIGRVRFKF